MDTRQGLRHELPGSPSIALQSAVEKIGQGKAPPERSKEHDFHGGVFPSTAEMTSMPESVWPKSDAMKQKPMTPANSGINPITATA
jgi:hypothetical protein